MTGQVRRGDVADYFTIYEYGRTTPKKVYLFGGWHMRPLYFRPMVKWLVAHRYAVVLLIPKKRLIAVGTPYEEIVTGSRLVVEEVQHRIAIDKKIGVREFVSIGVSLGTLFATELTKAAWEVNKLVLFSPFGDFTEHVQLWPRHRVFSRILASQPTSRQESGLVLNKVGIGQGIERLNGREVFLCYSNGDRSIHTNVTEELIRLMNRNGVALETATTRGGHIRGIATHMAVKRGYQRFLQPQRKGV